MNRVAREHNGVTLVPIVMMNETTASAIEEMEPNPVATLTGCLRLVSTPTHHRLAEPPTTESTDDSTVTETLSVSTDEEQAA
jgi:hypothetical protein